MVLRTSVPEFVSQHPNISITVGEGTPEELDQRLKQRNVDLLITGLGSHSDVTEYRTELITNVPLSVITRKGHPMQSQKNISFSQLAKYPPITSTLVGPTHPLRDQIKTATGLLKPHIACSDFPTLIAVLLCSDSWLVSSEYNCASELEQGALVKLDATHPSLNTELGIIELNKRSRSPAAQKFIDILTKELAS